MIINKKDLLHHIKRHRRLHKGGMPRAALTFWPVGHTVRIISRRNVGCSTADAAIMQTSCPLVQGEYGEPFSISLRGLEAALPKVIGAVTLKYANGKCEISETGRFLQSMQAIRPDIDDISPHDSLQTQLSFPRKSLAKATESFKLTFNEYFSTDGASIAVNKGRLVTRRISGMGMYETIIPGYSVLSGSPVDFHVAVYGEDAPLIHHFLKESAGDDVDISSSAMPHFKLSFTVGDEWFEMEQYERLLNISKDHTYKWFYHPMPAECKPEGTTAQVYKKCRESLNEMKVKQYKSFILQKDKITGYAFDFGRISEISAMLGQEVNAETPICMVDAKAFLDALNLCGKEAKIQYMTPFKKGFVRIAGADTTAVIMGMHIS